MRRVTQATTTIATVLFAATLFAQSKPNFTGKWTQFDPDPAAAAAAGGGGRGRGGMMGGGGLGQNVTLALDGNVLKVERMQGQTAVKEEYKLDGTEGKNTLPAFRDGGTPTDVLYTAKWESSKLVIATKQTVAMRDQSMTIEMKRELSLDASGNLVVVTTRTGGMMGGGGGQAPAPVTVKYKKAS
jgi:hypothetical protein